MNERAQHRITVIILLFAAAIPALFLTWLLGVDPRWVLALPAGGVAYAIADRLDTN